MIKCIDASLLFESLQKRMSGQACKIIVCLGGPLDERTCEPGGHLLSRLRETVVQFREGDLVIVTGGRSQHLALSEAEAMQRYLKGYNIPSTKEERSITTVENALFTRPIVDGLVAHSPDISVLVITSDFHLPRTVLIFQQIFSEHSLWFRGTQRNDYAGRKDSIFLNEGQDIKNQLSQPPLSYSGDIEHDIIDDARRGYKEGVERAIADINRIDITGCTALSSCRLAWIRRCRESPNHERS